MKVVGSLLRESDSADAFATGSGGSGWSPVTATGTGSSQNITLPAAVTAATDVLVWENGVLLAPGTHYTVSGTTLTGTFGAGNEVYVYRPGSGLTGPTGASGSGVPNGGSAGQYLAKNSGTDGDASWKTPLTDFPMFVAAYGDGTGSSQQTVAGQGFRTLNLSNVSIDTHSGWSTSNFWWTVPTGQGGTYEIKGKYRIVDVGQTNAIAANQSIGIGMHTSNADHDDFFWDVSKPNRNGIQTTRDVVLTAGQQIRLFCYIDVAGNINISAGKLSIQRIR